MRHLTAVLVISASAALFFPAAALAQRPRPAVVPKPRPTVRSQPRPRVTALVNGGYQITTTSFDDRFTFSRYQENGTTQVSYNVDAGPMFEGGIAIRLWKGLAAGGVISRFRVDQTAQVSSSVPHPFFLQRFRQVSGEGRGLRREENTVHIQAQYAFRSFGKLQVVVGGGPSVIDVKQSVVTEVKYTEQYPYDTATFTGVDLRVAGGTATGFNAGADFQWMFTRVFGVGGLVRYTRATVDLHVDNRTIQVDAGGAQAAAGVRLAFPTSSRTRRPPRK